jgi:lactate dehydrogenase-like 2-hydroxyacid dehydrogenase
MVADADITGVSVLVTGQRVPHRYLDLLKSCGIAVREARLPLVGESLVHVLRGVRGYLLAGDEVVDRPMLQRCPDLEVIAVLGSGYGSFVDVSAATDLGIAITATPRANTMSVVELTVAHVINARRAVVALNSRSKRGESAAVVTRDLSGAKVGVIGMGEIGTATARVLATAFGARVAYHSRTRKPAVEQELGARREALDDLLRTSDVVVLALTADLSTRGFLADRELALMPPHAVLVNTARAWLVDGHALRRALLSGAIRAAAFDGYYTEPPPDPVHDEHGLLALPDDLFTLTPHVGAQTESANERMAEMAVTSLVSYFTTGGDRFLVNPTFRTARSARRTEA